MHCDAHPDYWNLNELQVTGLGPLTAAELVAAADVAQARCAHRRVFVDDDATGARLAPAICAAGWDAARDVYMTLAHPRDREPAVVARETSAEELLAAKRPISEARVGPREADVIAGGASALAATGRARFFVADHNGAPAAITTLYSDGTTAQVEDVATRSDARGSGLARAVVSVAIDAALAAGHETVFLVAAADDGPRRLYAKLGFDPVGHAWAFVRPPEPLFSG